MKRSTPLFGVGCFLFSSVLIFCCATSLADAVAIRTTARRHTETAIKPRHAKLDVIVLDAGHGGIDPGAIGVGGYKEKQAALAIVLKLGKLIEKNMPGVKVVYTRHTDVFIPLSKRGQIANAHKGKLFICVHCNSTPQKPSKARGFTTYILRPGKTDAAIQVAARENAVIQFETPAERSAYISDLDFILTSMTRTQDVRFSETLAGKVQQELQRTVATKNNGVSQAGFLVLVGASMPSIYVETAFISNPKEEALLRSESGQSKFALGILAALKKYKVVYEKS
ncbi:MAG: N-acetylmuramoyl-L-alanine amidase [Candidatus Kapaibacterium sp.]|jgi:N-acetylmuramoyl-L-alanine amidase